MTKHAGNCNAKHEALDTKTSSTRGSKEEVMGNYRIGVRLGLMSGGDF